MLLSFKTKKMQDKKFLTITITCVELDLNETIIKLNAKFNVDGKEDFSNSITKIELIEAIREFEKQFGEVQVFSSKGTEVEIIDNSYLRTKGDKSTTNDLIDSPECEV
jgi:hypothetical protein